MYFFRNHCIILIIIAVCAIIINSCSKTSFSEPEEVSIVQRNHRISLDDAMNSLKDYLLSDSSGGTRQNDKDWGNDIESVFTVRSKQIVTKNGSPAIQPQDCDEIFYVVNFTNNGGWAVLAADDRISEDIIAVVDSGNLSEEAFTSAYYNPAPESRVYDPDNLPDIDDMEYYDEDLDDWYIGNMTNTTGSNGGQGVSPEGFVAGMLLGYGIGEINGGIPDDGLDPVIGPGGGGHYHTVVTYQTVTTTQVPNMLGILSAWSQTSSPYNDYTPTVSGHQTDVGCVNIALGKIMTYFEYPTTFNINGYSIDWNAIKTNVTSTAGSASVANLLRGLGVANQSLYFYVSSSLNGTFTLPALAAQTLSTFLYSNVSYSNYSTTNVISALESGCPVFVSSINLINGIVADIEHSHAWNIDGYKTKIVYKTTKLYLDGVLIDTTTEVYSNTKMMHCAFGWGGFCDGYFASGVFNLASTQAEFDYSSDAGQRSYNFNLYLKTITYANPISS